MFLFAFDPGFDFEPPSGAALFAEIGVDRHTVLEVFEDARAIRCPDRDSVLPDRPVAVLDTRAPFEQAVGADDPVVELSGGDAASKLNEAAQVVEVRANTRVTSRPFRHARATTQTTGLPAAVSGLDTSTRTCASAAGGVDCHGEGRLSERSKFQIPQPLLTLLLVIIDMITSSKWRFMAWETSVARRASVSVHDGQPVACAAASEQVRPLTVRSGSGKLRSNAPRPAAHRWAASRSRTPQPSVLTKPTVRRVPVASA